MPFFESSTGVLIKDSNFYDIGGDINVHSAPPVGQHDRAAALEFRSSGGLGHRLEGSERNDGHAGGARMLPHDNSPWPQIAGRSDNLYPSHHHPDPWSMSTMSTSLPSLSNPVPQPFPQLPPPASMPTSSAPLLLPPNSLPYSFLHAQPGFRFDPFGSKEESTPGARAPGAASSFTSQYPFEPLSNTTPEHARPLFADNHPSFASFPDSIPFQNVFEPQSGPDEPFFYPPGVIDEGLCSRYSTNRHGFYPGAPNRAITYQQTHFEPHYSTSSGSNYPFPGESNVTLIGHPDFLWHRPQEGPRTNIHGSTSISGNVNHVQRSGETGLQLLYHASAADALHNSAERYPQPKCHPETRTEMLGRLWNWACGIELSSDDTAASNILWLYGPAGAGKSAIAQTLCHRLEAESFVAASFFFKRGHTSRGNVNRLFSTIAYQPAVLLPELKTFISKGMENDPAIVAQSLSIQLQKLIIEPYQQIIPSPRAVIIIDGLDECDGQNVQQEILRSICHAIHGKNLPIQFLIASQPESHIFEMFHIPPLDKLHRAVNIQQSFEDVRKYLWDELTRIRREHCANMARVSRPWPAAEDIEHLVWKSSGYFIYASTVIKFIDDKNLRPSDRLDIIMGLADPDIESPLAALDQLYTQILSDALGRPRLLRILTVIAAKINLRVDHIEKLLELKPGDIELALNGLHSLVQILDDQDLTVHHASFLDFLNDPTRSGVFYSNSQHRSDLARQILKAFSYKYENRAINDSGPIAGYFGEETLKFIISVKPSLDLVSLLQSLNPDFLFTMYQGDTLSDIVNAVVGWLEEILPRPQGLIELWEDYFFMLQWDKAWRSTREHLRFHEHKSGEILSKAPSQFLKVLHACTITKEENNLLISNSSLVRTRFFLDLSWDELRKSVCPLRKILGNDQGKLYELFIYASDPSLCPKPASIFSDLSRGYLRVMRSYLDHRLPWDFRWLVRSNWGDVLRSCPPCDVMLKDVRELESASAGTSFFEYTYSHDFHNILQWLKTFPEPPDDLIARFEDHLECSILEDRVPGMATTFDELEEKWMSWRKDMVGCSALLQEVG